MSKKILIRLVSLCFLFTVAACVVKHDGPYEGRIIDADTQKPIEGVVVLGLWSTAQFGPGGASHTFYDAQETVTDKNGYFHIKGLGFEFFTTVGSMDFIIFKSGYEYHDRTHWTSLKKDMVLGKKIRWEGDIPVFLLKKLTMEERKKSMGPPSPPHEAQKEKIALIIKEINKDRAEQGLGPIDVGR